MCSWPAALRGTSTEFIIPRCWRDILVLDKLNKTLESIDVAVPLSIGLPRTYAENKNQCSCPRLRENSQGSSSGVVDTFHADTLTQTYVDGLFPRVEGSGMLLKSWIGRGARLTAVCFGTTSFLGKSQETLTVHGLSEGSWSLGG